ncbi:amino acid ABC transporter permease [Streptomyces sp. NPDC049577]|uniref:amino acid ABC transporter permease n=1 Tax=Streptomyces sp. NPDC049577 TaxID=3155153 RepID=UPI00341ADB05
MTSVLFDAPGPRARRRHLLYGAVATLGIAATAGYVVVRLAGAGQFTPAMWEQFGYAGVQRRILIGALDTFKAFALAVVCSLLLGLLLAAGRMSGHRALRGPATVLMEFFRAMPLLIMIFALYNTGWLRSCVASVAHVLRADLGWPGSWLADNFASPTLWALVIGIALYNGSVQAEILRAGAEAVPKGQREAAYALGMSRAQVAVSVVLPQAVRSMLPSMVGQIVVTLKDTSLGFIITYEELLYAGKLLAQNTATPSGYPYIPVLLVVGPIYIGMCLVLSACARRLARQRGRPVRARRARRGRDHDRNPPGGRPADRSQVFAGGGGGNHAARTRPPLEEIRRCPPTATRTIPIPPGM